MKKFINTIKSKCNHAIISARTAIESRIGEGYIDTGVKIIIGVVIGGHLVYGLTNFDKIVYLLQHLDLVTSPQILFDSLYIIFGGQVF